MIEIRYGEHYEMADAAGKSVAQAREQYKQEFGIPDKAQASLNSKGIKQKHEPKTALGDNDSLTFAQKSMKGLFFVGAILLALAVTGARHHDVCTALGFVACTTHGIGRTQRARGQ